MLDINEINNTIETLENDADTTFDTCLKLASLYTVRDNLTKQEQPVVSATEKELNDILPQYQNYCKVKRRFQLNEVTEQAVFLSMKDVCTEIKEFLHILYSSTDTQKERDMLKNMVQQLQEAF